MNLDCIYTTDGNQLIKLHGEMDALGCTLIRPDIEKLTNTDDNKNVILDLSLVSFLDSSGVGMIVFLFKRLKAQGRTLEICGVQGQPQELMELLRIDKVIPVSLALGTKSLTDKKSA